MTEYIEVDYDDCPESSIAHDFSPTDKKPEWSEDMEYLIVEVKCNNCGLIATEKYEPTEPLMTVKTCLT